MKRIFFLIMLLAAIQFTGLRPVKGKTLPLIETNQLVVSAQGPYTTLDSALEAAQDGDVITVYGGVHPGHFLIDKSVTLEGIDWPALDGENQGTVITLLAPDTTVRGFVISNSGASLDEENSGLAGKAPGLLIENNQFVDTLFGVYLSESNGSIIRSNSIQSKDLDVPRRGDPIRVWYSNDVLIEDNMVVKGRDVVLWYSERITVQGNSITEGRYGLHFMYCDDAVITNNYLSHNSVGTFMMYSRRLRLTANTITYNHGPSGFGIGLKDMDDAVVRRNLFFGNRIGAYLDNSPREVDSTGIFDSNIFAYNDMGVSLMPSVRHNKFYGNSFIENQEHVNIAGGGTPGTNLWTVDGQGNYWSDYAGYDQDSDGIGNEPYKAERLFENLMDKHPNLRLLIYSPATQAVDFAAKAVPFVRPQPKLVDEAPLMAPVLPQGLPPLQQDHDPRFAWGMLTLLIAAVGIFTLFQMPVNGRRTPFSPSFTSTGEGRSMIHVSNLSKKYGSRQVLSAVSFQIQTGEAVALWGPNGAGKTTALRSLLGVIPCEGTIIIAGHDLKKQGKQARRMIGFVPQELTFHDDLTVLDTLTFYGKLKHVDADTANHQQNLLVQVGLVSHQDKLVGELSGGMKQRLALAVALLGDPPLLLLDEPTSNLDAKGRDDFLTLLVKLKAAGKTLVFSSHRLEEVAVLADRVLLLEDGVLTADVPPYELSSQASWNVTLYLRVPDGKVSPALETLVTNGFHASPNGKGVRVKVTPGQKAQPIGVLTNAGISVVDFEIEH